MISKTMIVFFCLALNFAIAQTVPPVPDSASKSESAAANNPPTPGVEETLDASGLVINKNIFNYDGTEGRDPFKVYREYVQPTTNPGGITPNGTNPNPSNLDKNIRTAMVPEDVVVQGILYKKNDSIALVVVKGVKGLNKLRVSSPIGRNEGKVIEIRKDRIIIEQVKDFDGQKFSEKIELKLREKKN